jgi:hypothetical protein
LRDGILIDTTWGKIIFKPYCSTLRCEEKRHSLRMMVEKKILKTKNITAENNLFL